MKDQQDVIRFLSDPHSYPHGPATVSPFETHMAWVFLAGDRVFKLKKSIRFHFLDFTSLAARKYFCEEELRLNQRICPEIYLRVLPVCRNAEDTLAFGTDGEVVDYCIEMRRLPADRMLDHCLAEGRLTQAEVTSAADAMIDFYLGCEPEVADGGLYVEHIREELAVSRRIVLDPRFGFSGEDTASLLDKVEAEIEAILPEMAARIAAGFVIEGHGDLRPEHVCLVSPPVIFDCLEFDRRMRIIDPFDELNYLGLECEILGAAWVRRLILEHAERRLWSPPSARYMHALSAFRGVLRAQISLAHLLDEPSRETQDWIEHARIYLAFADNELKASRGRSSN